MDDTSPVRLVPPTSRSRLLLVGALAAAAPLVPAALSFPATATPLVERAAAGGDAGASTSEPVTVVERLVSGDMVVDWLEAPPAGATDWVHGAEAGLVEADGGAGHADELFQVEAATTGGAGATTVSPGQGFALFSTTARLRRTGYTIRLTGADARVEQYRDEVVTAARAATSATGLPIRVAAGRGGSTGPAPGEITVVIGDGPCGANAVGCGGAQLTSTTVVAGRVWLRGAALTLSPANRSNLAMHELGHALGLRHYDGRWHDGRQVMYPSVSGTPTYRSGDGAGLKYVAGGYDRQAGAVASTRYAAGRLHVAGVLRSGSRVRVTVGSRSQDVTGSGGRFAASLPAPAGTHRVCAAVLDAAPGFLGAAGCTQVTAPGTPFGRFDRAAGSFETIRVDGWAADPQTAAPVSVQVRRNGVVVTTVVADASRADVAAGYPGYGDRHGFRAEIPAVAGSNEVCLRVVGVGGGGDRDLGCRKVVHHVDPSGSYRIAGISELGVTLTGWALDPNTPEPVDVVVRVDGVVPPLPGRFRADADAPHVARAHPAHGPAHGFSQLVALAPGDHEVCLEVVNVGLGADRGLGCARVHVAGVANAAAVVGAVTGGLPSVGVLDDGGVVDEVVEVVGTVRLGS